MPYKWSSYTRTWIKSRSYESQQVYLCLLQYFRIVHWFENKITEINTVPYNIILNLFNGFCEWLFWIGHSVSKRSETRFLFWDKIFKIMDKAKRFWKLIKYSSRKKFTWRNWVPYRNVLVANSARVPALSFAFLYVSWKMWT